jgi:uncharacterized protein YuzE
MRLTHDPRHNVAYLRLKEKPADGHVRTVTVSESVNIDLDADGTVFGIELLNANDQIFAADGGAFVFVDEAAGRRTEFDISAGTL